jgi:Vacuolar (H+)-ATPase G subunit
MVRLRLSVYLVILTPTQATQQTQGIQTLLEAEKEAAKVVQQARQRTCIVLLPFDFSFKFVLYIIRPCAKAEGCAR